MRPLIVAFDVLLLKLTIRLEPELPLNHAKR
jgi:hypothetical protein